MPDGDQVSLNPQPIPPGRVAVYRALSELTFASLLDADGPSGSLDPRGPGGPVMRDIAVAMALYHAGSVLADESQRAEVQELAQRIADSAVRRSR